MDEFEKQMEQKFMKDLQNIEIGDSDTQLESSTDFYQGLKKKINSQIVSMRASTTKNTILQELKANLNKQISNVQKFQDQIKQMKLINNTTQNAIAQQKIQQIKNKIAKQNASKIILADQQIHLKESTQNLNKKLINSNNNSQQNIENRNFSKKTHSATKNLIKNDKLQEKFNEINLQRQRINMQRQDELSLKNEKFFISEFFKQRFINFQIPKTSVVKVAISNIINKPKSTFTNLFPLANNQKNVLPKNSLQIALKTLKKNKRVSLIPTSQVTVKIQFKKVQDLGQYNRYQSIKQNQPVLCSQNTQNQNKFKNLLEPYLQQIQNCVKQLETRSYNYKPKFIKNYLNQHEKISNIDMTQGNQGERSVEEIMQRNKEYELQSRDYKKLKQLRLTFERVTNLKGIQKVEGVEIIALQYNMIKSIKELNSCNKLIQLNISNNQIKDMKSIQNLKQLRYLNINNNRIKQLNFKGGSIEILHIKNNQIQTVNDLSTNKYLKIIDLSYNKLHFVNNTFSQLYFLQQLNLQHNYLESLQGIQNLIMLQKFNISHNRLKSIEKTFTFMFLNFLDLSYNQISVINNLFLPSLQILYITNNKIVGQNISKSIIYLPELKEFNIDDNQIKGFSIIWFFIKYSKKLQIIKYDSNEYFLSVRQKVRQIYEAIIYKNMNNIKILNHSPFDTGLKAYYQSLYGSYFEKNPKLQNIDSDIKSTQELISFLVEENKMIVSLESQNDKYRNERFIEQSTFIQSKSIQRAHFLKNIIRILSKNYNHQVKQKQLKKQDSNKLINSKLKSKLTVNKKQQDKILIKNKQKLSYLTEEAHNQILKINKQIYFHHDQFQYNLLNKIHQIKTLFFRLKHYINKKDKYFKSNKNKLLQLITQIQQLIKINSIKKVVQIFSQTLNNNKEQKAAIMIQKNWRGYKSRKLFNKLIKKLKNNQDDSFQMEQVDLDQFQAHEFPQFNFQLPDDINFQNYIIQPKYFQIEESKNKKRKSKIQGNHHKLQQIEQKQEEYNPMINNFMKEEKKNKQKEKKKEDDEKLMKQWGFQNPATLQALRWRKKRKQEMKRKEAQQNMTAAQRYERFKNMHK